MHKGALSNLQLQNDLRNALENNELILNYQPIMSLENSQIVGFEALIRWMHPTRGLIMPNDFIPIAEETGLILPIGNWVLRESCRQMNEWQNEFTATKNFVINVNLSPLQIEQDDLIYQVDKALQETGLSPNCLKLEITESVLMKNTEASIKTVSGLRDMGVKVSIDDFGTGYSSLSYLHNFAIDTLKVDRSFINLIGSEKEKTEIIQTIITLALSLGIDVVAEGVETLEQLEFLKANNCNYGQGYYYSKPVGSLAILGMLEKFASEHSDNFQLIGETLNSASIV
jgi:EAL domain-containing protein (putative c-di-GMP-specific phosphodiesterase class I)